MYSTYNKNYKYSNIIVKVYLDVPFSENEIAKSQGATWDSKEEKWYYKGEIKNLYKLGKWFLNGDDYKIIAIGDIYLFKGKQCCYRCHNDTTVIGLGFGHHIKFYMDENGKYRYKVELNDKVYLSWVYTEKDIPPRLLKYMQSKYNVRSTSTKTGGPCFANHCEHCDAVQGNHYIFNKNDNVFMPLQSKIDFYKRLQDITLYRIPTEKNTVINWYYSSSYCSEAYLTYCKCSILEFL